VMMGCNTLRAQKTFGRSSTTCNNNIFFLPLRPPSPRY
jgi:hypothetical protein